MNNGRIPKDFLYGELVEGCRTKGRPRFRFHDICKRDMKSCSINFRSWESLADDRAVWRMSVKQGALRVEMDQIRKQRQNQLQQPTAFIWVFFIEVISTNDIFSSFLTLLLFS
ncbi:hypothetical protein HELRODRAFT_171367 [Helobdella robusta]|uniref:Uncharacterized protein n=1 Tax=Helobdella robusta TaxID=6412 RepID=T1F467_HELRO|nr:hypothetical protein HELRODRAFT_171367 [Helobdella robusta]ESO05705.1 hypothetical protein HELRODRAFT_171367 [Helobdella robusta]